MPKVQLTKFHMPKFQLTRFHMPKVLYAEIPITQMPYSQSNVKTTSNYFGAQKLRED